MKIARVLFVGALLVLVAGPFWTLAKGDDSQIGRMDMQLRVGEDGKLTLVIEQEVRIWSPSRKRFIDADDDSSHLGLQAGVHAVKFTGVNFQPGFLDEGVIKMKLPDSRRVDFHLPGSTMMELFYFVPDGTSRRAILREDIERLQSSLDELKKTPVKEAVTLAQNMERVDKHASRLMEYLNIF